MSNIFEYNVFMSFSSKDKKIAKPIWQKMRMNGLRVFWSDEALKNKSGESWLETMQLSLEQSQHFLLICTPSAMASKWVNREWNAFYSQCIVPGMRLLVPLLVDNFKVSELPIFLRDFQACRLEEPIL